MNKLYLITLSLLFYPFNDLFEFQDYSYKVPAILLFIVLTYSFKKFLLKTDIKNRHLTLWRDKIKDLFPILSLILLGCATFLTLAYLKETFGKICIIISICYIVATIFSTILLNKKKYLLFIFLLIIEYFLISLIPFNYNNNNQTNISILSLYFSFTCFLVSLKLLDMYLVKKIPNNFLVKLYKGKPLLITSIIFILSCIYPLTLGILAITFFKSRNLILAPFLIVFFIFALKKLQNINKIKYIKTLRGIILIFPILILYLTYLLL